ncbi:putative endosomal integral membrane protein [Zalerion maritima]|uniref:Transmembrane 9 superfamily member n=1 Tax=Zalerion maritima TaxID=339359 RepID=A0AAD5WPQ1_9PEZI|nr:putative endosomal integral membrane protein [Zalerion maritima]
MKASNFAVPRALLSLLAFSSSATAFYLPGVAPTSYKPGDSVPLYVNNVKPVAAPGDSLIHSVTSYDYYYAPFHYCRPEGQPKRIAESLGSILFGDRILTSPFELDMAKNETCKSLCTSEYERSAAAWVNRRIAQGYNLNWIVDGLPAGQEFRDPITDTKFYSPGFLMGNLQDGQLVFYNHYDIIIDYHEVNGNPNELRVVGARVNPSSRKYSGDACGDVTGTIHLDEKSISTVKFSYGVYWKKSNTAWATRWDKYLHVFDPKIQWFFLVNTAVIDVFLVLTVTSILFRALKKDIARYNRLDQINLDDLSSTSVLDEGVQEDSGWKLVHGDVFRSPSHPLVLSVMLGSGVQLFVMFGFTIVLALMGFLSPSNRGSLGTITILSYTILSTLGGYTSARVYKSMGGEKWKTNILFTPLLVPGVVFSVFFVLNLFLWAKQSSGAVPFTTMLVIVGIWFVISVPLSFAGSWLGFKASMIQSPVKTNQIPRQIPFAPSYLRLLPTMLEVGILPFLAILVELYFILTSFWFNKIYYMFGFLFLCYTLMIVTSAAVTVLMVYHLLCAENYNWQWRAFLSSGMTAGYVFLTMLVYWLYNIKLGGLAGSVLYLGYSALISFLIFILTGSVGYFASWWFVRKIYSSIKVD